MVMHEPLTNGRRRRRFLFWCPARQEKRKMWTWLQKLFGTSPADEEAPDIHVKASSQTALARALHRLKSGQRGWVTIAEAGPLFSADDINSLGEMDDDGRRALEIFAAKQRHRSTPTLERSTRRIYFTRL